MDWHELEKMRVSELRELAKDKTSLEAVSGLHKEELVEKLAEAMGIPRPHRVVDSGEKFEIKQEIRRLKVARQQSLDAGDRKQFKRTLREIHGLKRKLRRMAHLTH